MLSLHVHSFCSLRYRHGHQMDTMEMHLPSDLSLPAPPWNLSLHVWITRAAVFPCGGERIWYPASTQLGGVLCRGLL